MDALKFSFNKRTLDLCRISIPTIEEPNDILVKVSYAGICGTDLQILAGNFPCRQTLDLTLGHEISGVVAEVGNDVIHFKEGDKVTINPNMGCERCTFCHAGKPHFCKIGCVANTVGIYRDGGWAQYILVPEEQVFKLKPNVTLEQGVLTEPLSCVAHGWDILSPMEVGQRILITGAGMCGNLWTCALHLQGHRDVTISEPLQSKLDHIRKLNTAFKLITPDLLRRSAEEEPEKFVFDVVIDCSGSPAAIEQGFSLLNSGGKLMVFGVTPQQSKVEIKPFDVFWKELKIYGSRINPFSFQKAVGLIESMGSRYLNYNTVGIKTYPLNDYKEAIDAMKTGKIGKAVFKM